MVRRRGESMRTLLAALGCLALVGPTLPAVATAAPKAELWEAWLAHDPEAPERVDHGAWDALLARYVEISADGIHRFRYGEVDAVHRRALSDYLEHLAQVAVSGLSRDVQSAYWINLYNALTVRVVLDHYPVDSIREIGISPGWWSVGPWRAKLVRVEGREVSLDDIEHRILRPIWRDPRIHYALNCASVGCPNLALEAFTAENRERLLEAGARAYVNHPRGVRTTERGIEVSSIYRWFEADFGGSRAGVLRHLRTYAEGALLERLESGPRIVGHDYDWSLNDARGPTGD